MSSVVSRTQVTFKVGTTAASGASTETTIALGTSQVKFRLRRVKVKRVAGTAANLTPYIVNLTGATSTSVNKVWLGAATGVATLIDVNPSAPADAVDFTDASGNVYLVGGWDAGADNTASYVLSFEILA
tara:strand:- start:138 stop:524 length:387 start_codon:yes stop_codon:yes gene_type:complete